MVHRWFVIASSLATVNNGNIQHLMYTSEAAILRCGQARKQFLVLCAINSVHYHLKILMFMSFLRVDLDVFSFQFIELPFILVATIWLNTGSYFYLVNEMLRSILCAF